MKTLLYKAPQTEAQKARKDSFSWQVSKSGDHYRLKINQNPKSLDDCWPDNSRIYITGEPTRTVTLSPDNIIHLPYAYAHWVSAIENSRYISGYQEVDEQTGITTYYSPRTWIRAMRLLADIARAANAEGSLLPEPIIYDGDDGSIDIRWKNENFRLLINLPAIQTLPIAFHGDDKKGQNIKGKLIDLEDLKNNILSILKSA